MARPWFDRWLNRKPSAPRRRRRPWLSFELLEERILLDSGLPPALVVGRMLSSYTTAGVQNNRETLTFTVYNEQADPVSGVLLTDTLQPGVTFQSASQLPDQSSQNLAWSLGTIQGFDRASVTLTVSLANPVPLQLDGGAHAFATLDAGPVTADTPAATLTTRTIPADQLASTPDANTTDPYVQEQAAKLRYDPQTIFTYLATQVGYESYTGSLRGARGTLWSSAGNSLDEASLGVALFRASGIPARYAHGTLSDALSKQLILSMFPASFQMVGYIPAGTQVADPANDPKLLAETRDHYWLQIDTGSGFQDADTSGLPGGGIGTAFTAATGTFTEVADSLRHKVRIQIDVETYSQAAAAFGLGGLGTSTVLNETFNDVELVGRPLTVGQFVNTSGFSALIFASQTTTYSPYVRVGDAANPDGKHDGFIRGTDFQEVQTNFPLGSSVLTGLFLKTEVSGPDGVTETFDVPLVDRIGFAARQGLAGAAVSVNPNGPPALTDTDFFTIHALPGKQDPSVLLPLARRLDRDRLELGQSAAAGGTLPVWQREQARGYVAASTYFDVLHFLSLSDAVTRQAAAVSGVRAYFDHPRITIASNRVVLDPATHTVSNAHHLDLRRDGLRVVPLPGQNLDAVRLFRSARGFAESSAESAAVRRPRTAGGHFRRDDPGRRGRPERAGRPADRRRVAATRRVRPPSGGEGPDRRGPSARGHRPDPDPPGGHRRGASDRLVRDEPGDGRDGRRAPEWRPRELNRAPPDDVSRRRCGYGHRLDRQRLGKSAAGRDRHLRGSDRGGGNPERGGRACHRRRHDLPGEGSEQANRGPLVRALPRDPRPAVTYREDRPAARPAPVGPAAAIGPAEPGHGQGYDCRRVDGGAGRGDCPGGFRRPRRSARRNLEFVRR
jgi:uncharacterized repeat protein (TIGR01451 family)